MQGEVDAEETALEIRILGLNETGQETGNSVIVNGRTLPWLQDNAEENVWGSWEVTYRDVIVLDEANEVIAVYNLTTHNLGTPAEYDELKAILLEAAD